MTLPKEPFLQPLGDDADLVDEPPGTGGMLVAFQQFKLLLTKGREGFSDFYYFGSEPLDGREEMVDVLISRKDGIETRWYFRKTDRVLVGFDSTLGVDVDPAEIRLLEMGTVSGRPFPTKLLARSGEKEFATFHVASLEIAEEKPVAEEKPKTEEKE